MTRQLDLASTIVGVTHLRADCDFLGPIQTSPYTLLYAFGPRTNEVVIAESKQDIWGSVQHSVEVVLRRDLCARSRQRAISFLLVHD